jgi:BCL2-associated athanogene 3
MKEDSIVKIKKIQSDVLALMDQVEHFEATGRKDKRYLYLDEMLTQNLLKLDTVDTEGKDNIKLARREAIKCINHCISVLEAKVDAADEAAKDQPPADNPTEATGGSQPCDKKSASADNVLKNSEQSAEIKKSSSQK